MNPWGRQGLAVGASAALALTCGAWSAAQTTPQTTQTAPQSTQQQTTPQTAPETTPQSTQQSAPASQTAPTQATPTQSAAQPAHRTLQMVQAQAQLDKTIDSKKAKQGDPVTAKLVADVKVPDAQPLPKNTVLEGHVDQVTASDHKSDSTMVVTFDKAKLKDGQEVPIKATILAMAEPSLMSPDAGGGGGGGAPAGGSMAPAGGGGGGGMAGGGGGGGARGSSGGGSAGASSPPPQAAPSGGMPDAGGGSPGQQQPTGNSNVPDVTLTSDIHQHNSATFTGKGKNVHVPDGTQMELAIGVIPPGVTVQ